MTIKANVRVNVFKLDTTMGMLVSQELLNNRRLGKGTVITWVCGHGGDVWLVKHSDDTQAVYSTEEMVPIFGVICRKCGKEMEIGDIRTVADRAIVDWVFENTTAGIGIHRCECDERIFLIASKEDE